jgi:hypothetical protein
LFEREFAFIGFAQTSTIIQIGDLIMAAKKKAAKKKTAKKKAKKKAKRK